MRVAIHKSRAIGIHAATILFAVAHCLEPAGARADLPLQVAPTSQAAAPARVPVLTQKEMLEDYDRFTSIVEQVFPLTEANQQVYGLDLPKLLRENRNRISHLTTTEQFVELINATIFACRGNHFWLGCTATAPGDSYLKGFVADDAYPLLKAYDALLAKARQGNGVDIPLLYFEGSYYTARDFTLDGQAYPKGMKVQSCNGTTPDAIVATLARSGVLLRWDYELKKSYTPVFYKFCPLSTSHRVALQFEQPNGAKLELTLEPRKPASYREPRNSRKPLVTLVNSNILYVKLPMMDPGLGSFWKTELPKYKGCSIQKVVADIRNNPGGGDPAWMDLLALLVRTNLNRHVKLGVKDCQLNREYLARSPLGDFMARYGTNEKISFLNNEEFKTLTPRNRIEPATNSLGLACKIFVLSENVYSAAGNLLHWCAQNDQLVSVGIPSGLPLGQGTMPYAFSLPNSKLVFTIEPLIDLTDARTAVDTHHIGLKVRITPTLQQLLDYYNTGEEVELERRLNEHDPFFQKVRTLE